MARLQNSLIKLAENPSQIEKADDDSMDYEEEEESSMDEVNKGRTVSGPRTKLSNAAEDRFSRIENSITELAKAVSDVAKSNAALIKGFGGGGFPPAQEEQPMPPMEDDFGGEMGGGDEFGAEDDLDLGAENMFGGNFDPYGGDQQADMRGGDVTMQLRPDQMVRNAKVAKDDSSSNFGEKDSDIPGNRKLVPDDKEKSAEEVLIQGGPSAGYSVNKAQLNAIAKAVAAELRKSTVAKSAQSPEVSNSQIAKAQPETFDVDALMQSAVKKSFGELNRERVKMGLLADGIL